MKKNSLTPVGRISNQVEAVNQVFALFRLNYHNQYYRALPSEELAHTLKKIWLKSLKNYSATVICEAAERLLMEKEYLPTIKTMLEYCQKVVGGPQLPDVQNAFHEACSAPYPKESFNWSHALVYHAGASTGWHILERESEAFAFAQFETQYQFHCNLLSKGELKDIPVPIQQLNTEEEEEILTSEQAVEQLNKLKELLS